MSPVRRIGFGLLIALLVATFLAWLQTARRSGTTPWTGAPRGDTAAETSPIDRSALASAQELASRATTPDERRLAQEALHAADDDLDLAFAEALRQAAERPTVMSEEVLRVRGRIDAARQLLQEDRQRVARLKAQVVRATGRRKAALEYDLELAQAQIELDQDDLDDARQDLVSAGGDPQSRIRLLVEEHQAAEHASAAPAAEAASPASGPPVRSGLVGVFREWWEQHELRGLLRTAVLDARAAAGRLSREHDRLEKQVESQIAADPSLARGPSAARSRDAEADSMLGRRESEALAASTRLLASDKKALARLDKRLAIRDRLAGIYTRWIDVVETRQWATLHAGLIGILLILLVGLFVLSVDAWLETIVGKVALERRRARQVRAVIRGALRVAGVLLVLLVVFGPPGQVATVLGLAGAGLTVALKDFIVGFIGWFVLMGKNGIRLGDWVEINGVSGEVVELGPLHTVLLETGNWAESGHPTGRRVTFVNSFAIDGHYFNFSTSGQWLWDEVRASLPAGQDPYPLVEAISTIVANETQANARLAESEWTRVATSNELKGFTATPAVSVRPSASGLEIVVRYITRANERHRLRSRLYHAIVELLGRRSLQAAPPAVAPSRDIPDPGPRPTA